MSLDPLSPLVVAERYLLLSGRRIKQLLDSAMPKSQIIVARKP
jgi:hypothetical protein